MFIQTIISLHKTHISALVNTEFYILDEQLSRAPHTVILVTTNL